jgi:hypothetical protein
MSRKLTVILLVMLVLTGAMGLKTIVTSHADGAVIMASGGGGPVPPSPWKSGGGGPVPPSPWKSGGGGPVPPSPWK